MCGLYHSAAACYDASPVPMPMDLRVEPRHCMFHTEVVYAVLRGGRVSAWGCARASHTHLMFNVRHLKPRRQPAPIPPPPAQRVYLHRHRLPSPSTPLTGPSPPPMPITLVTVPASAPAAWVARHP